MQKVLKYTGIILPFVIAIGCIFSFQTYNLLYIIILWMPVFFFSSFPKKNKLLFAFQSILWIVAVFLLVIFVRVFFFEVLSVPTESMKSTINPGEKIVVSKRGFPLNGKLKKGDIPWINLLLSKQEKSQVINIDNHLFFNSEKKEILRSQIIVFRPEYSKKRFVKRCVGIPGDTLNYRNNGLYINRNKLIDSLQFTAKITYTQKQSFDTFAAAKPEAVKIVFHNPSMRELIISFKDIAVLNNFSTENVELIKPKFPDIQVLKKGFMIIPEKKYFVLGDNTENSSDSRDHGLVSEKDILGSAEAILFSKRFSDLIKPLM